ncbi:MAG: glycosyltransferase [Thermodesulfobacteriota bacterium]|nr:glycosyltransferase [Thermodesulfobacteriota bacterium]
METPLRILVVLPLYGGSLPIGRYCEKALAELGHLVEVFEAPLFHSAFEALKGLRVSTDRLEYLENSFLQVVSQAVLAKTETFSPDLVLSLAQAPLSRQALNRLRKDNVPTAMWFVEDFRLFTYWRAYAPLYDFFAVIQEEPFLDQLYDMGLDNALYLPLAADPGFHKPLELTSVQKHKFGSDVSFLGAGYPNRQRAFKRLFGYDFKIWGTEWDNDPAFDPYVQRKGARISPEDAVKVFNAAKINLNLHSSVHPDELVSKGDFVNPRTFELAACKAFQLVDERALLPELFKADELVTFTDMEDLLQKIDHYLAHGDEREKIAKKSYERALAEHTYAARMQTLLDFIKERRSGWPSRKKAEDVFWEGYHPELKEKVLDLLNRLKLPLDTNFEDFVWTLKQQQGKLSDLETAVLFLDEWQKQYGKK